MVTWFCRRAFPKTFILWAVLLTYLLWGAMVKLREGKTETPGGGSLFWQWGSISAAFAGQGTRWATLYPNLVFVAISLAADSDLWLPLSWTYTFMTVPNDGADCYCQGSGAESMIPIPNFRDLGFF